MPKTHLALRIDSLQLADLVRGGAPTGDILKGVAAWLVINSMASDKIQFQQLLMQNAANVWRKNAFRVVLETSSFHEIGGGGGKATALQLGKGEDSSMVLIDRSSFDRAVDCFVSIRLV